MPKLGGSILLCTWPYSFASSKVNATKTFVETCDAARQLLKSYNKSQPLAPQLAALMDHKKVSINLLVEEG